MKTCFSSDDPEYLPIPYTIVVHDEDRLGSGTLWDVLSASLSCRELGVPAWRAIPGARDPYFLGSPPSSPGRTASKNAF